ncbi:hypothetical protein AKG43_06125 [Neisseria sp. 74A18]|nr:hypothetical protein AKG43_06125 [Neisseria sp. 74A18]
MNASETATQTEFIANLKSCRIKNTLRPLQNPQMWMQFKAWQHNECRHIILDRQTSGQRTTQKCAVDGGFAKVSGFKSA